MTQNRSRSKPSIAKINGIEIAYETFGDPTASPLLLIMGLGNQMVFWDEEFCTRFAARGYRVIRLITVTAVYRPGWTMQVFLIYPL